MGPAEHWYTSPTSYGAASLLAVVMVGAVTVSVTYVVGAAKRQLTYGLDQDLPLALEQHDRAHRVAYWYAEIRQRQIALEAGDIF